MPASPDAKGMPAPARGGRAEATPVVRQQLEGGSLVIRQMTAAARRRYPPRPAQPRQLKRR
jgi:hypothetical protein